MTSFITIKRSTLAHALIPVQHIVLLKAGIQLLAIFAANQLVAENQSQYADIGQRELTDCTEFCIQCVQTLITL